MSILENLNTPLMFIIAAVPIIFIALTCLFFLVKSYRAGLAMGMDKKKLKTAITSSATFTVLPSVSILLGVITLSGTLGIPLPWLRLSVIGALHYEGNVADIAARASGLPSGLGSGVLTAQTFVTIGMVMTAGILIGAILCIFVLKSYLAKVNKTGGKAKGESESKKKPFGDVVFSAMFIGLVSAYIGSYLGTGTSQGNWTPLIVAGVSAVAMGIFEYFSRVKNVKWLDNFSMACSMLVGMAVAVVINM